MNRDKTKAKKEEINEENGEYKEEEGKGKKKRSVSVERRKKAKEMDRASRWSGLILLIVLMLAGFLLWVFGQMGMEKQTF